MADTPTPATVSETEARALEMMVKIRELARTFNGFTFAGKGRRVRIANFAALPDEFFELMALACDSSPEMATGGPVTSEELRAVITTSRAYRSVAVEMRTQAKGLEDSIAEFRGDVGRRALNAYNHGNRLKKQEGLQTLVPHLEAVRRALGRGRSARKDPEVFEAAKKKEEAPMPAATAAPSPTWPEPPKEAVK